MLTEKVTPIPNGPRSHDVAWCPLIKGNPLFLKPGGRIKQIWTKPTMQSLIYETPSCELGIRPETIFWMSHAGTTAKPLLFQQGRFTKETQGSENSQTLKTRNLLAVMYCLAHMGFKYF